MQRSVENQRVIPATEPNHTVGNGAGEQPFGSFFGRKVLVIAGIATGIAFCEILVAAGVQTRAELYSNLTDSILSAVVIKLLNRNQLGFAKPPRMNPAAFPGTENPRSRPKRGIASH